MKKKLKQVERFTIVFSNAVMTTGKKSYDFLNRKFADFTKVTIEEALIELHKFLQ